MDRVRRLIELAQKIADDSVGFFETADPGSGNRKTNEFMRELRLKSKDAFDQDFSECRICGDTKLAVDFYFPEEATIVEIALSLKNPNTEFEKDILKALMAQESGHNVARLLFLSKPGAEKRRSQQSSRDMIAWVKRNHKIEIKIKELTYG